MEDEVTVSRIHSRKQYDELFDSDEGALCRGPYGNTQSFEYKGIGKYIWYNLTDSYNCGRASEYYLYFLSEKEVEKEIQRIEKEIVRLQNLIEDIKKD